MLISSSFVSTAAWHTDQIDTVTDLATKVFSGATRSQSRPAGPVPQEPFRAGQTVVVQPNVVTPDRKAGVQTGEMVLITDAGIERLHATPRGFHVI